ncbi:unnamed protein product [Mortierella alpina]
MKWKASQHRKSSSRLMYALAAIALSSLLLHPSPVQAFGSSHKKVRLRDVQTLTFHKGRLTTGRRTSPVPQTSCVGGNACGDFEPDVIQCKNAGFDGSNVQWKCQAELPDNLKFGKLDVYCEGFDYPDDPYVLKGSCGLEYNLHYTDMRYDQRSPWGTPQWVHRAKSHSWTDTIFLSVWIGVVGYILYSFVRACLQRPVDGDAPPPYRASGGGSGGHGGGGGGGGDGGGWGSGWGNNNSYKYQDGSAEGFRPGFWSGLGLGGLATYLATQNQNRRRERAYASTSNFFSGWGEPSAHDYSNSYAGPSGTSSYASSSRPTRTATGFGETRRR